MTSNIHVGYGLILQEKFSEAIKVLEKEHDFRMAKLKAHKGNPSYNIPLLEDIRISEGYLLWASGMDLWIKGIKIEAEKALRDSYDALNSISSGQEPEPFLVEHLLSELRRGKTVPSMNEQLKFMNEWSEKHRHKSDLSKEDDTRGLMAKLDSIESEIKRYLESEVSKKRIIQEAEENLEYKVWYKDSKPKGELIDIDEKEKIVNSPKYNLLIIKEETHTQIFINGKKTKGPPGKLAYRILTYVLKNKGTGGTAWNIAKHVWDIAETGKLKELREIVKAVELKPNITKAEMQFKMGNTKGEVEDISKRVRRRIEDLNKLFLTKIKTKLQANEMDEYELIPAPNYCLIEKH